MVLIDLDIVNNNDDGIAMRGGYSIAGTGYTKTTSSLSLTDSFLPVTTHIQRAPFPVGTPTTTRTYKSERRAYFLFRGITIPQGSVITDATFTYTGRTTGGVGSPGQVSVRARLTASPTVPTGSGGSIFTKPLGTQSATDSIGGITTIDTTINAGATDIIQELVDAFDYNNDNMMLYVIAPPQNLPVTPVTTSRQATVELIPVDLVSPNTANLVINFVGVEPPSPPVDCDSAFCEDFSEYAVSKLPTLRDNFNFSTQTIADLVWVTTDTAKMRVDPVNEKLEIDAFMDGTDDHITFDLGFVASDRWVLRGRITFVSDPGVSGAGSGIYFGLSDNKDDNSSVPQENAYMGYLHANILKQWGCSWGSPGGLPTDFNPAPIIEALPLGVELYWELKREGNVLTGQIFNNSDFTDSRGISTLSTISAGEGFPENLRFIKFYNRFVSSVLNRVTYEVDDIEFWDEGLTTTVFDNFSTDQYTDQDSPNVGVNTTTQRLEFDGIDRGANQATTVDYLGQIISDTKFVIRFKLDITAFTDTSSAQENVIVGISDLNSTNGSQATHDFIGINFLASSGFPNGQLFANTVNGGVIGASSGNLELAMGVAVRFIEIRRTSPTSVTITSFSDSTYETIVASVTNDATGIQNLRFFGVWNLNIGSSTNDINGFIDDVEIYDGVSSVPPKRLGSQQGDITFQDNFELKPVTFSDDFTTDNFTNIAGTKVLVNTGTGVIDWSSSVNAVYNEGEFIDILGEPINTDNWILRMKLVINTVIAGLDTTSNDLYIGLSNNTALPNAVQDFIGWRWSMNNPDGVIRTLGELSNNSIINGNPGGGGTIYDQTVTTGTFFIETKRSGSNVTGTIYSDASFTTVIESITSPINVGITGLRFLKVMVGNPDGSGNHTYDGTIDDIQFYNGNSTLTDWVSKVTLDSPTLPTVAINTTTKALEFNWINHFTSDTIYHDLLNDGITVNEKDWTLRCKATFSKVGEVTINTYVIGLYDNDEQDSLFSPQDFVNIFMSNVLIMRVGDGINLLGGTNSAILTFPTVDVPVFWEIKRIGGTTVRFTQFSDSKYTKIIDSADITGVPSTVDGLRFIKCLNRNDFPTASEGVIGTFEDIEFYNGVAVPRTPITEPIKLFDDSVVTDKGWVTTDATAMAVNLTTQVLDINVLRDGSQDAIAFDLGAGVLSETRWGLRFKYDITAVDPQNTGTKRIVLGLFDTNQTASIGSPQDGIMLHVNSATDTTLILANATDGTNPQSQQFSKAFTSVITEVQTLYVEIIRISATSYSIEIFSDPDYSISREKQTLDTISAGISGLRYLKFLGDETSGPVAGSFTGTIDDIQLWNDQAPLDHKNKWRVLDL